MIWILFFEEDLKKEKFQNAQKTRKYNDEEIKWEKQQQQRQQGIPL